MFKWSVIISTVNVSGGSDMTITKKDTEKEATDLFYDTLSRTGGNPSTKFVRCELRDEKGNTSLLIERDNSKFITEV